MSSTAARPERDDHPPSTPDTSSRRVRRWSLLGGLLIVAALAVAAPVVAAEPASAPAAAVADAADVATTIAARPADAVRRASADDTDAFADLGDVAGLSAVLAARKAGEVDLTPPPPPTTTTTAAPTTTTTAPPTTTTTAAPAPEPVGGRCGGDLPPCWVMQRESGGNIRARNPHSSASGKWQFIDSTWAGFGGYAQAWQAPESVQDAKARALWAGGAGCGHWNAC